MEPFENIEKYIREGFGVTQEKAPIEPSAQVTQWGNTVRSYFNALVNAGFNENQALSLVQVTLMEAHK